MLAEGREERMGGVEMPAAAAVQQVSATDSVTVASSRYLMTRPILSILLQWLSLLPLLTLNVFCGTRQLAPITVLTVT